MYRILGGLAVVTVGAIGLSFMQPYVALPARVAAAEAELPAPRTIPQFVGAGSCASASCHQRPGQGVTGREYAIWIDRDPHARALQVLYDERSERIVHNLGMKGPAHAEATCLKCHATYPPEEQRAPSFSLRDGVSCESCHGPASGWLTQHYLPEWKLKTDAEKALTGMKPTKDLVTRTQQCVACHVGEGDRDVNHDLIAAGHPRLNFENGRFLAHYSKHWSARAEKERYPDFEARAWAIGQAVTAQAALKLLAERADAEKAKPWPEFAEYGCYACHKNLKAGPPAEFGKRLPGSLPWGTWYFGLLEPQGESKFLDLDLGDDSPLGQLRKSMADLNPDRQKVADQAKAAATALDPWIQTLAGRSWDAAKARGMLRQLTTSNEGLDWDAAAQRYLAIAAFHHAMTDLDPRQRDPELRQSIKDLLDPLGFEPGFGSPVKFDPQAFRKHLEAVRKQLGP